MFPSVCSVADHRCVKIWYEQKRVNLYHILTSSGTITRTVPTCVYASILEKLIDKNQSNFSQISTYYIIKKYIPCCLVQSQIKMLLTVSIILSFVLGYISFPFQDYTQIILDQVFNSNMYALVLRQLLSLQVTHNNAMQV